MLVIVKDAPFKVAWEALAWKGTEYGTIRYEEDGYVVDGKIDGTLNERSFDIEYEIDVNSQWQTILVKISWLMGVKKSLCLHVEGKDNWLNSMSRVLKKFSGCSDVDISLSAFTNTLPIRRLDFRDNSRQTIKVVYIDLPSGKLKPLRQWYTQLTNRSYRYEDENGYSNVISVDNNGLVVDYPGLFRRKF
ncbi:MAG: putative glycolipid-binding domain-containing protein [Candidatus Bathyarchaeia archaeon]